MRHIKYNKYWNKVKPENIVPGREFTTVRGYTPSKEEYYVESIGKEFHQLVDGTDVGTAQLITVSNTRPSSLGIVFMRKDTFDHYTMRDVRADMKAFYRNEDPIVLVLTLKWVNQEKIN